MERWGFPAFVEEVRQRRRPWVASFRPLVTGILRYCGALVAPAETAAAALAITETLRPDVIIVDFSFPTDSGVALNRSLRALKPEDVGMIPVIAIGDDTASAARGRSRGIHERRERKRHNGPYRGTSGSRVGAGSFLALRYSEWASPSGPKSQPYGIYAINDAIWYSESGTKDGNFVLANSLVNAVTLVTIGK